MYSVPSSLSSCSVLPTALICGYEKTACGIGCRRGRSCENGDVPWETGSRRYGVVDGLLLRRVLGESGGAKKVLGLEVG
jgi:hypothetical protein